MTLQCACGSTLFIETTQVRGPWKSLFDSSDPLETIDTDLDELHRPPRPKTVKCADCGKRHRNPRIEADQHALNQPEN